MVNMTWESALESVVASTGHKRYRYLASDANPDEESREAHRRLMVSMATGQPAPAREYPSMVTMAGNVMAAAGKVVKAAATGQEILVTTEVYNRRLAICRECPEYDAEKARCTRCGCWTSKKLSLATQACPLPEPKWGAIT